jgi:hypothetical protein
MSLRTVERQGILPVASRTGNQTSKDPALGSVNQTQTLVANRNFGWRGILVEITIPASPGSGNITPVIYGTTQDGTDYVLLQGAAISSAQASSVISLMVDPTIPTVANVSKQGLLPPAFHVDFVDNNGSALTYGAAMSLFP